MDQAERLRAIAYNNGTQNKTKVLSVTSGKGGVGKTNIAVNMATHFARKGLKVLLIDADLGLANADLLLGVRATLSIDDIMFGEAKIEDIFVPTPAGFLLLPGSSGVRRMLELDSFSQRVLFDRLFEAMQAFDVVLYDTAPGIGNHVLNFNVAAHEIIVVSHPELTSLTDAYALIKVLAQERREKRFRLIINRTRNANEGLDSFRKLTAVADEFLNISIDYMGYLPEDAAVQAAVRKQRPVTLDAPRSSFTLALNRICDKLLATSPQLGAKNLWDNCALGQ